jgi:protein SCO1
MRRLIRRHTQPSGSWQLVTIMVVVMLGIVAWYARNLLQLPPTVSLQGLIDQDGRLLDDKALGSRYKLVFFGFTQCASVCPLTLVKVRAVLDAIGPGGASLSPLFVSVDPIHDGPGVLRSYTESIDSRIIGVTGEVSRIDRLAEACGAYALRHAGESGPASVEHSARLYLMAPDNSVLVAFEPNQSAREIARDIAIRIKG